MTRYFSAISMSADKNIPLRMIRENLENIPQFTVLENFTLRWFKPGDEQLWTQIQRAADKYNSIMPELFRRQFGDNNALLAQRQCFVFNSRGDAIGTATAWFNDNFEGARVGRIHWITVLPQHQGEGLGKVLMTATCNRLRELGHARTYLSTSSARIAAINLYLRFGFAPLVRSDEDSRAWKEYSRR
jgi:GNAT superfamily N-acetyltransferase